MGLYYNGMRNDANAARAPLTSALLCSADGELRRDCTSCPLGSAYFSLLRPHTRLAAHCGPTNARLRAHLGLVVPEGDCEIVVGGEARRWAEGKVLLFDDSFEHEVHGRYGGEMGEIWRRYSGDVGETSSLTSLGTSSRRCTTRRTRRGSSCSSTYGTPSCRPTSSVWRCRRATTTAALAPPPASLLRPRPVDHALYASPGAASRRAARALPRRGGARLLRDDHPARPLRY